MRYYMLCFFRFLFASRTVYGTMGRFVKHFFENFVDAENKRGYNRLEHKQERGDYLNTRIKMIRESLNLTQEAFGKRIGSARNTIANYETGNRTPSNAVFTSICKEFNVNEKWLRYGEGEMFLPKSMEEELIAFTADLLIGEKDDFKKRLLSALAKLSEDQWDLLENIIDVISQQKME